MSLHPLIALVVVSALSVGPAWLLYLGSPARRSLRALAFLVVITVLWFAGVALLPSAIGWAVVVGAVTAAVGGLFGFHELLGSMPAADFKADETLWNIQHQALQHRRGLRLERERDRLEHVDHLKAATDRVRSLVVPGEWEPVRRDLLAALDADRTALEDGRVLDQEAARESARRWHTLKSQHSALRARQSDFWR